MFKLFYILLLLFNILQAKDIKKILILHSYHQSSKWVQDIQRGIDENLDKNQFDISIYIENMDTKRYSSEDYYNQLESLYKIKYKDTKFDGIIASDNNAYEFLLKNRDELFGNIPVSFLGINFFNSEDLKDKSNYTGVLENEDFETNIKLMKLINPNLKTLYITADNLPTAIKVKEKILNLVSKNDFGIEFKFNDDIPFDKLLEDIKNLSNDSAVLLGIYFKDSLGHDYEPAYTAKKVVEISPVPVFTMFDWFFNNGVLGGNMISSYEQGKTAANYMNKILSGENISSLSIQTIGTNKTYLDFQALKKFKVNDSIFDESVEIRNKNIQTLTKDELNWILENPKLVVGIENDWMPFDFVNKYGEHDGITSDILKLISQRTGLKFEYKKNLTWEQLLNEFKVGNIDILPAIYYSKDRDDWGLYTKPYIEINEKVYVRNESSFRKISDLNSAKFACVRGYKNLELLRKKFENAKIIEVDTIDEALNLLNENKVDVVIDSELVIEYLMKKNGMSGFRQILERLTPVEELRMIVHNNKKYLHSILEKSIKSITLDELSDIKKKWSNDELHFTHEELKWIEKKIPLKYVYDVDWAPFEWKNEIGKHTGILKDLLDLVSKKSGLIFDEVETQNWQDAMNKSKQNDVDMFSGINIGTDTKKYMNFTTRDIYGTPYIFLARIDDNREYYDGFDSIKTKKVGIVEGYYIHNIIKTERSDLKLYPTKTIQEGLTKLLDKELDLFIVNMASAKYYMSNPKYSDLKIVAKTNYNMDLKVGIKKEYPQIVLSILDKTLDSISEDELNQIFNKWTKPVKIKEVIDWELTLQLLSVVLAILMFLYLNNRKLKSLVKEKTSQLQDLLKNLENKVEIRTKELSDEKIQVEKLNEELKIAKDEAENVSRQKSEFLANMSHEIRTPMNSVIGFTEILDKELINPVHKEYLSSIKKGGQSLLRIINDILDLSKIEAGKLEIKNESINLKNLFMEIETIFHSKIISKNIHFDLNIDASIPKYVIIDSIRLRQILFNLIGNAIKFTEKGFIKVDVQNVYKDNIKSKIDLIFSVEDSGIGIDEKNLQSIFIAFEQQENHDVAKYGGTGLGLAICTKLVQMMNGRIGVQSTKGVGSKFTVTLKDLPVSSIDECEEVIKFDVSNIVFENSQILVVDDIEENRKLVEASLKDYNIDIIMAQNGQEAIDRLKNLNVDLILMDLRMPVMNGYEATQIIKNDDKFKHIPVIALTASVMGKDLEKVSKFGFNGYLRKPVILDDLIKELTSYLKYSINKSSIDEDENNDENMDEDELKKVISLLENEYKKQWELIKDNGDFTLTQEFAQKLENLAKNSKISILGTYSMEILKNIEAFDIEKVDFLMNTYLDIIKKLKGKI